MATENTEFMYADKIVHEWVAIQLSMDLPVHSQVCAN